MAGTVAKINAARNKISRGEDLKEEMAILLGPNASWEDFLVPTPMYICLLGELMIISAAADVSLNKNPPKDGFKLIKYPNSFRACLMQVANVSWDAFNKANTNIDQIRLLSSNVPGHLKEAVTILMKGENYELEDMLLIPLNAIQDTADNCLALATSVEKKFIDVMDLTAELLKACVNAKGSYEQEYKEVEIAREIAAENKRTAEEQKAFSTKAYQQTEKSAEDGSATKHAIGNARFKIEQSTAQLEYTREKYDKACDKMMESITNLGNIMAEIAKLDIKKMDFETTRKTLSNGIKALAELREPREQWGKIVMFFQMMSNLIKVSLNTSLKEFLKHASTAQSYTLTGYPISSLKKDMIYQQASQAAKISYVVNMISGSYVEISNKYLMDRLAGLGKLLSYDHETQLHEIQRERQIRQYGLQEAQASIRDLVLKRKKEFNDNVVARVSKIKNELESALPPESLLDKSTERIQKAVQQGLKNVKATQADEHKGLDPDDFV